MTKEKPESKFKKWLEEEVAQAEFFFKERHVYHKSYQHGYDQGFLEAMKKVQSFIAGEEG